jgi:hypothetical protein
MEWYEMTGLTFILIVFVIGVVIVVMRWFHHRERLAMIERGLVPPGVSARRVAVGRNGKGLLIGGIGISMLGLALLCAALFLALPVLTGLSSPEGLSSLGLAHLPGLFVLFMGIALIVIYVLTRPSADAAAYAGTPDEAAEDVTGDAVEEAELEPFIDTPDAGFVAKAEKDT